MTNSIRASFMPIAEKCAGALHGTGEGVQVKTDAGVAAAGGNAIHKVCELIVRTGGRPEDLSSFIEQYACDPDHLGVATWYAHRFWQEHGGNFPHAQTEVESKATLGNYEITGHVDVRSLISATEGEVLDWKGGYRTDTDVEPQMRSYAYLLAHEYDLHKVRATVVWLMDQTFQRWEWTLGDMVNWATKLSEHLHTWEERGRPYVTGEHCRYCPQFLSCPAQKALLRTVGTDLVGMGARDSTDIQPAEVGRIYTAVQGIERLCERFRQLARDAVARQGPIPMEDGMQLALVTTQIEEIKPREAWPTLRKFLEEEELAECIKVGKGKLLDAVARKADRGQKGKLRVALMEELATVNAIKKTPRVSLSVRRTPEE